MVFFFYIETLDAAGVHICPGAEEEIPLDVSFSPPHPAWGNPIIPQPLVE